MESKVMDIWLLLTLVLTNAVQFWFWSRQNHSLVDKLMCRNYAEYVQTNVLSSASPAKVVLPKEDHLEESAILDELNGAFGFLKGNKF